MRVDPIFKPKVNAGVEDTINVDPDFLRELPMETPMDNSTLASEVAASAFPGFTYDEGSNHLGGDGMILLVYFMSHILSGSCLP